ncbi:hypothetical protein GYH30_016144 [Glycine max]|uniref:Protein kinase domain-containing protein n=1 Tax=Glycine max TaxID=3847 RepID=A0A0R0JTG6_SOYBN|nr:hypothetical protein GYH30_016144 [Glycine max]
MFKLTILLDSVSYSLHINCGGKQITVNGNGTYDDDTDTAGPARFHLGGKKWGSSSTGHFMDNDRAEYSIWLNQSKLFIIDVELYMDARKYGAEGFQYCRRSRGVNKAVTKSFTIVISSNTLEIRLYWAGKETIGIPFKSVYGRLISAIPVNPKNGSSMSAGSVAAIVAGVVVFLVLLIKCANGENSINNLELSQLLEIYNLSLFEFTELKGLKLQMGIFTLRQIKAATNNFNKANKIGEGGFGPVYKGNLSDGTIIAVKQLSSKSRQGNREFLNELGMISALQHPCLVKLYGCCVEGDQLLLRDIKATNVLLDKNLNPWISDFGLAKLDEEDNTHISTRIAGTYGYMAPEYTMHGYLTDKADVYSFGVVVALEIVSGRSNMIQRQKEEAFHLLDWLVDRRLGLDFYKNEVTARINVSLLCTNVTASLRPTMSLVVSMLEDLYPVNMNSYWEKRGW